MTSERKQRSNRANARLSTGPKTAAGKARASKNARRHGLNLPVLRDLSLAKEVETMAARIAGEDASDERLARSRAIAEAQIDLQRIRLYRLRRMQQALDGPPAGPGMLWDVDDIAVGLSQIAAARSKLTLSRRRRNRLLAQVRVIVAAKAASAKPLATAAIARGTGYDHSPRDGNRPPDMPATSTEAETSRGISAEVLVDLASQLAPLDRYERRAISRRNSAIHHLDRMRRHRAQVANSHAVAP